MVARPCWTTGEEQLLSRLRLEGQHGGKGDRLSGTSGFRHVAVRGIGALVAVFVDVLIDRDDSWGAGARRPLPILLSVLVRPRPPPRGTSPATTAAMTADRYSRE